MLSFSNTSVFIFTCFIGVLLFRFQKWHRLRHIPGPFWASVSNLWMLRIWSRGNAWRDLGEICENYVGPVVRVGPNEVLTGDIPSLKRMWGVRTTYKRSNWYSAFRFNPDHDNLLSTLDDTLHNELRAKMVPAFSGTQLDYFERVVDTQLNIFIDLIESNYLSSESSFTPFDLASTTEYFTLDIITELTFGKALGFLERDGDVYDYLKTVKSMLGAQIVLSLYPHLGVILQTNVVKRYLLPSEKDPLGLGKLIGVAKSFVAERFGPDKKEIPDLLGAFLKGGLTQNEAESELLLQIIAGSDTTATAIRMTFLYLSTSPFAYANLKAEVRKFKKATPIIKDAEAKKLPYLQACIKEGLRMWIPIPALGYFDAPAGGDTIGNVFIPGGTKVGIDFWAISRNKDVFGVDAHLFRPERWITTDTEKLENMDRTVDMVFKPGRWQCIGKPLALIELNKAIFELVHRFDFVLIDPTKPMDSSHNGIFFQSDMFFQVKKSGKAC